MTAQTEFNQDEFKYQIDRNTTLRFIDSGENIPQISSLAYVEDIQTQKQYILNAFLLEQEQGNTSELNKKIVELKKQIYTKEFTSILKYFNSFQIDRYFIVTYERYGETLEKWAQKNSHSLFYPILITKIAIQVSRLLTELHNNNLYLNHFNQGNIFINDFHEIKVCGVVSQNDWLPSIEFNRCKTFISPRNLILKPQKLTRQQLRNQDINSLVEIILFLFRYQNQNQCSQFPDFVQTERHQYIINQISEGLKMNKITAAQLEKQYTIIYNKQLCQIPIQSNFDQAKFIIENYYEKKDLNYSHLKDILLTCHSKNPKNNPLFLFYTSLVLKLEGKIQTSLECLLRCADQNGSFPYSHQAMYLHLFHILNYQIEESKKKTQKYQTQIEQNRYIKSGKKVIDKLIRIHCSYRNHDQAISLFHEYQSRYPNSLSSYEQVVDIYLQRGSFNKVFEICNEIKGRFFFDFEVNQLLYRVYQQFNRPDLCQQIKQMFDQNGYQKFDFYKSLAFSRNLTYEDLIKCTKKALQIQPKDPNLLERLIYLFEETSQYSLMFQPLWLYYIYQQQSYNTTINLSNYFANYGKFNIAKKILFKYYYQNRRPKQMLQYIGQMYYLEGKHKKSQKALMKANIIPSFETSDVQLLISNNYYQTGHTFMAMKLDVSIGIHYPAHLNKNILKMNHYIACKKVLFDYGVTDSEKRIFKSSKKGMYFYKEEKEEKQYVLHSEYVDKEPVFFRRYENQPDSISLRKQIQSEILLQKKNRNNKKQQQKKSVNGTNKKIKKTKLSVKSNYITLNKQNSAFKKQRTQLQSVNKLFSFISQTQHIFYNQTHLVLLPPPPLLENVNPENDDKPRSINEIIITETEGMTVIQNVDGANDTQQQSSQKQISVQQHHANQNEQLQPLKQNEQQEKENNFGNQCELIDLEEEEEEKQQKELQQQTHSKSMISISDSPQIEQEIEGLNEQENQTTVEQYIESMEQQSGENTEPNQAGELNIDVFDQIEDTSFNIQIQSEQPITYVIDENYINKISAYQDPSYIFNDDDNNDQDEDNNRTLYSEQREDYIEFHKKTLTMASRELDVYIPYTARCEVLQYHRFYHLF